jgi:TolB-like protein/Tfp pilus assembly protein PilF
MFADMVGYTKAMQKDESVALSLLNELNQIFSDKVKKFGGHIVKSLGDGFLVEFNSARKAVFCSIEVQDELRKRNEGYNEGERILLRVGLHIGEVIERENDVYGDAVNIASRVVSVAEPSSICMTEQVYKLVSNKIKLNYVSLGQKYLKNVLNPVEIYSVTLSSDKDAVSVLPLNRLAVLPFLNISPDPNDSFFADGLTEELIFRLSRIKGINVIARTSIMQYKNKEKKVSEIGRELGSGLIIEGSVRKAGNRIRVTAQLINANNEEHLWAETYERNLDDLFRVQEEIVSRIAESLPEAITTELGEERRDTDSIDAYTLFLRASQLINSPSGESVKRALNLYKEATTIAPNFARAYIGIARCNTLLGLKGYLSYEEHVKKAKEAVRTALRLNPNLPEAHSELADIAFWEDKFDITEKECKEALELNPSLADAYHLLSLLFAHRGNIVESFKMAEKANSLDPSNALYIRTLLKACLYSGQEEKFLLLCNENFGLAPFYVSIMRCQYYMSKREFDKAENELKIAENLAPDENATLCTKGMLEAMKGNRQKALDMISLIEKRFEEATATTCRGDISYLLGDTDTYYQCLMKLALTHSLDPFLSHDILFKDFTKDKRFKDVLAAIHPRESEDL